MSENYNGHMGAVRGLHALFASVPVDKMEKFISGCAHE